MHCFGLFQVTVWKLVILALLVILNVALYARSTYLFDMKTRYSPVKSKDSNLFVQTNNTSGGNFSHSLQTVTYNTTTQFYTKPIPKDQFLMEKIINPHNFEYLIHPNVTCSDRKVDLVICVPISIDNHAGRSVIRSTWGSYAKDPNNKAFLLFFVGSENKEVEAESRFVRQSSLQEEASTFGDIVQENYIDSYRNLSLKSVSILKWVNSFCPKTKYILKVDDDVYMNIPFLIRKLQEFVFQSSPPSAFILGMLLVDNMVLRDPTSKYYVPYTVYPENNFPNYIAGPSYVISGEAAWLLYQASLRVPLFFIEDVYITGFCARKAQVPIYHSKYFTFLKLLTSGCSFRNMVCAQGYTHEEIIKIHAELYDPNLKCCLLFLLCDRSQILRLLFGVSL